jgi:uncharacterized protein (DUF427 family)
MKKNILFCMMFNFLLLSCGGGSEPVLEPQNLAPSIPSLVSPTLAKLCISNSINFEWTASTDAENNPIVYQLQIATDNLFTQNLITKEISTPTHTETLEKGKAYYWRVKATDSKGAASAYSTVYSFFTEGTALTNHAPFLPQLVAPVANAIITGTTTTLKWTGSDVDGNDVLTYDVYLGTTATPTTKVVDNKTSISYDATLLPATIYYWKVVVRDAKGAETQGQVWSFRTN